MEFNKEKAFYYKSENKDAIAKKYPESTLKSASLSLKEEGVKAYRIVYVTKEGVENSILINIKTAPAKTAPATK